MPAKPLTPVPAPQQPRLFISHSSQDLALTAEVKAALATPSGAHPGFDVLVDTDCLQSGGDWPIQLHAMMAYANAGLLLFTPAAMARPDWIRKEAYILTWRNSLNKKFKVFYAYRDGVTYQDLVARGLEPAHLNLIQELKASEPLAIADEVRRYGPPPLAAKSPFEELTFYLTQHLTLSDAALSKLANDLGAPPVLTWLIGDSELGVNRIAARLLAGQFGSIEDLSSLINQLKLLNLQKASLKNVMRWVGPYWLEPEAVSRMAAMTALPDVGVAAINGKCVALYTAKMFVYRLRPFRFEVQVADVETGTHKTDADYYTRAICKWLRDRDLEKPYDERLHYSDDDSTLMEQLRVRRPFLFVPIKMPDPRTLSALRKNFETVVFLVWTGEDLEPLDYEEPVVSLQPAVNTKRENQEYVQWLEALDALGGGA